MIGWPRAQPPPAKPAVRRSYRSLHPVTQQHRDMVAQDRMDDISGNSVDELMDGMIRGRATGY